MKMKRDLMTPICAFTALFLGGISVAYGYPSTDVVSVETELQSFPLETIDEPVSELAEMRIDFEDINPIEYYQSVSRLYTTRRTAVRMFPSAEGSVREVLEAGQSVAVIGRPLAYDNYVVISIAGNEYFVEESSLDEDQWYFTYNHSWNGAKLNTTDGVVLGPSGYESYYNLPMGGVIKHMRYLGFEEDEWPYWVREDGAKMLGNYIMVAADNSVYPKGTIVTTSLGQGIVCDTGGFIYSTNRTFDVAVAW